MPSILKTPSHKAQLGRHGHDLSRRLLFTSSVGHLIPVLFDYLSPGEKVRLNDMLYTRTAPLSSPAFCRIKEHIEYFFVPIEQINSYFGQAFYGISDVSSSLQSTRNGSDYQQKLPNQSFSCTIDDLCTYLFTTYSGLIRVDTSTSGLTEFSSALKDLSYDMFGQPLIFGTLRLLDMLDYGHDFFNTCSAAQGDLDTKNGKRALNLDAFAVYQKIYYDYYRLSQFEGNNVYAYNYDYALLNALGLKGLVGPNIEYGAESEYISNMFTIRYRPLKKDFFTNVLQSPLYALNPSSDVNPNSYNTVDSASNTISSYILSAYGVQLQQNGVTSDTLATNSTVDTDRYSGVITYDGQFDSVQNIRLAFAYDKMMSITQRAGKHYDDQTLAHFGVSVPQGISGECYFLGGHTSDLNIAEVVATAAGSQGDNTSSLGELAGRGYGSSNGNRDIKFTAPCHGYIMAIYSAVPEISYTTLGLNRLHTYASINDFPHPEFDNIGMQPLWLYQLNNSGLYNGTGISTPENTSNFYGWQYRWSELKMSYDRTSSGFCDTLQNWAVNYIPGQYSSFGYYISDSVAVIKPFKHRSSYIANFYCSPDLLDNIFSLQYSPIAWWSTELMSDDRLVLSSVQNNGGQFAGGQSELDDTFFTQSSQVGYWWSDSILYSRDPLYHSIDFKYYKTSWMSTYGLPSL